MKTLQEIPVEPNSIQRRINQIFHLQQTREKVYVKSQVVQKMIKKIFYKRTMAEDFYIGDKVLKWDSRREDQRITWEIWFLVERSLCHLCL